MENNKNITKYETENGIFEFSIDLDSYKEDEIDSKLKGLAKAAYELYSCIICDIDSEEDDRFEYKTDDLIVHVIESKEISYSSLMKEFNLNLVEAYLEISMLERTKIIKEKKSKPGTYIVTVKDSQK